MLKADTHGSLYFTHCSGTKSFCWAEEAIARRYEYNLMKAQQHQIWTLRVINKTQEQCNLFHLPPAISLYCRWKAFTVSEGLSVLPWCLRLHSNSLYFCSAGSSWVSQVLIDTLISRPCAVLISLWFDSLSSPFPPCYKHTLLADTRCALVFSDCHS